MQKLEQPSWVSKLKSFITSQHLSAMGIAQELQRDEEKALLHVSLNRTFYKGIFLF